MSLLARLKMIHPAIYMLVLALALGAGAVVKRVADPTVHITTKGWADGIDMVVGNTRWSTLWGKQALTFDLVVVKGEGTFTFTRADMPQLCAEVLQALPDAPAGITAADVYRLNLGKIADVKANTPLTVVDGACTFPKEGALFFPNYPPPLQDWMLTNYEVLVEHGKEGTIFTFEHNARTPVADLPFAAACEATLTEWILANRNLTEYVQDKWLRVTFVSKTGWTFAGFSASHSADFNVEAGHCVVK